MLTAIVHKVEGESAGPSGSGAAVAHERQTNFLDSGSEAGMTAMAGEAQVTHVSGADGRYGLGTAGIVMNL